MKVFATVITDASHCSDTQTGGWAAWVRVSGIDYPIKKYDSIKGAVENPSDAEMLAAVNGIWLAKKFGATHILVQSDCKAVCYAIDGKLKSSRAIKFWKNAVVSSGVNDVHLTAKHVAGHTNIQDARSYVNRWCDRKSRQKMREKREMDVGRPM